MLLKKLNIPFSVISPDYQEDMSVTKDPHTLVRLLSFYKAEAVAKVHPDAIVIGADSIVFYNNQILGKPHTPKKAFKMLQLLNGTVHSIITGVTVIDSNTLNKRQFSEETVVHCKRVTDRELKDYLATGEPLDKAGGYALQEKGKFFIDYIDGDIENAIGLPVERVRKELTKFRVEQDFFQKTGHSTLGSVQ